VCETIQHSTLTTSIWKYETIYKKINSRPRSKRCFFVQNFVGRRILAATSVCGGCVLKTAAIYLRHVSVCMGSSCGQQENRFCPHRRQPEKLAEPDSNGLKAMSRISALGFCEAEAMFYLVIGLKKFS
jgi:hypothetical protein